MSAGLSPRILCSSGVIFGLVSSSLMQSRYPRAGGANQPRGVPRRRSRYTSPVFFFFSNRLGCLGSIVLSIVLTVILMAVLQLL